MTVQPDITTVEFAVSGMHCESCSTLIKEVLSERAGVASAIVDFEAELATVTYDASTVGVDELCATVADVGYRAKLREPL